MRQYQARPVQSPEDRAGTANAHSISRKEPAQPRAVPIQAVGEVEATIVVGHILLARAILARLKSEECLSGERVSHGSDSCLDGVQSLA